MGFQSTQGTANYDIRNSNDFDNDEEVFIPMNTAPMLTVKGKNVTKALVYPTLLLPLKS